MAAFDFQNNESNAPNREELLQLAIRAAKAGNPDSARVMFREVLSEDRRNERAMLWLAKIATSKSERRQWLTRLLTVNPSHQAAKDALRRMDYKSSAKDNRVLVVFGAVVVVLAVLGVVLLVIVSSGR